MEPIETNGTIDQPIDQKTNFFSLLHKLLGDGLDLTMTFKRDKQGGGPTGASRLIVGVRPQYSDIKDHPVNMIRPILLTHDPDKLDEAFFITLTTPLANVRDLAAQVEEFNKSVEAAKAEVSKKKEGQKSKPAASTASKGKKAAPVKKAAPAKPAKPATPKAPKAPQLSKEEKKKLADEKQAKAFMGYAEGHASKAKYKEALVNIDKALKLSKDKAYVDERARVAKLMEDAETKKRIEEANKKVAPLLVKAEALAKSMNYGELGHTLHDIFKLSPDNIKANEIKAKLVDTIGQSPVDKLIHGR